MSIVRSISRRSLLQLSAASTAMLAAPGLVKNARAQSADYSLTGKDMDLLLWAGGPTIDATMIKVQEAWTMMGGGKLNYRKIPYADLDRSIRAVNQGGAGADVLLGSISNVATYAKLGVIQPVSDMFTKDDLADFFPVVRESTLIGGEFYGPSTNENGQALYFDKRMIDRLGVKAPEAIADAWNWQTALEIFKEVQAVERARLKNDQFWAFQIGPSADYGLFFKGIIPRSAGSSKDSAAYKFISDDGTTVKGYLDSAEALEGLQFMQDLHQKHRIVPLGKQSDQFYSDQIAFRQGTPYEFGQIRKRRPDMEVHAATVPFIRTPIVHTGAFVWLVNAKAANADDAKQLVRFLGSREGNGIVSRAFTSPPIRRSMVADFPELKETPMKTFVEALDNWSVPRPITAGASELEAIWVRLAGDIISGGNVEQLAKRAVDDIDRQLERYYR